MSFTRPPVSNDINVQFPTLPVLLGVPVVILLLMLLLHLGGANEALFYWMNGLSVHTGEPLWAHITLFGEGLLALSLVAPIARWRRDIAWSLLLAALLATLVVHGLKELFDMPRPSLVLPKDAFNIIGPMLGVVSFPSGHATTITIFATVLALHLNRSYVYLMALLAIVLVGGSRVVVGAHWPMDILGGMVTGWLLALAGIRLAQHLPFGVKRNWQTGVCLFSLMAAALFWGADTGQHQALLLQQSAAIFAGVFGLVTLAEMWWPARARGS